jgi:hypothetical protein
VFSYWHATFLIYIIIKKRWVKKKRMDHRISCMKPTTTTPQRARSLSTGASPWEARFAPDIKKSIEPVIQKSTGHIWEAVSIGNEIVSHGIPDGGVVHAHRLLRIFRHLSNQATKYEVDIMSIASDSIQKGLELMELRVPIQGDIDCQRDAQIKTRIRALYLACDLT